MKRSLLSFFAVIALVATVALFGVRTASPVNAEDVYTVSFYDKADLIGAEEVAAGGYAVLPATPVKDGLVFLYWKKDGERFNFSTPITGDVDLEAEWLDLSSGEIVVVEMCSVRFFVGGKVVSVQSVEKGADAIAPTIFDLPEGKKFSYWSGEYTAVIDDTDVYAVLVSETYTVTVYGLGDEPIAKIDVEYGEDAILPAGALEAENYALCIDEAYSALTNVTEDRTVYLNYVPVEYTATFIAEGEIWAEYETGFGTTVKFPPVPKKAGYTFAGWYIGDDAYDFGEEVTGDITLYARFAPIEKKKYSVVFYNYDGVQYGATQRIEEGKKAIAPGSPAREGYELIGWADESGASFDLETPITSDLSLYPRYKAKTYSVKVMSFGEVVDEQFVKFGENAVEPAVAEIEGYDFAGYDGSFRDVRKDTVITAKYTVKTFTVIFIDGNGKKMGATQHVEYGKSAVAPKAVEAEGYRFVGWSEDTDYVTDDLVISPEYEKLVFVVSYVDEGETIRTLNVGYGEKAVEYEETKDGLIFAGYASGDGALFDMNEPVRTDLTLYIVWEDIPEVFYTVTFYVDDAIYSVQQIKEGDAARTPADPAKYGYDFVGWDADLGAIDSDLEVKAAFAKKSFIVTFVADNKTVSALPVEFEGYAVAPEAPEKEGYNFVRWNFDFETAITEDITVKAVYRIKTFVVTFVADGKIYDEQEVEYGDYAEIPETPAIIGKTFKGWYIGEKKFRFSSEITADTTITAKFEEVLYTITYYVAGEEYAKVEYAVGSKVTSLAAPELSEDERFVGWTGEIETMPARNVSVKANVERRYALTYYINNTVYAEFKVWEGEKVAPMSEPATEEGEVFNGWIGEVDVMPSEDVVVFADIIVRGRYSVAYYFNGALYIVAEYYEGDPVAKIGDPEYDDEDVRFIEWIGEVETMPAADVNVVASVLRRYTITYYVYNDQYKSYKLWQGEAVPASDAPDMPLGLSFNGWIGEVETMPAADVVVTADIVAQVRYAVRYFLYGELYAEVYYYPGEAIAPIGVPDNIGEHKEFVGWIGEPEIMPEYDVEAYASIGEEEQYVVYYIVGERTYATQFYYEGDVIVPVDYEVGEHMFFYGWEGLPETMPAESITVYADISVESDYSVTYIAYGKVVGIQRYYENDVIIPVSIGVGIHEVFNGWKGLPEKMPAEDITVYADITDEPYYTVTYVAYGKVVGEQSYYKNEVIDPISIDVGIHETLAGWKDLPEKMPAEDITVYAEIVAETTYSLVFYLDGKVYATYTFYAGDETFAPSVPDPEEGYVFGGWSDMPDVMPARDFAVYGYYTEVSVSRNEFTLYVIEQTDDYAIIGLRVSGDVDVAGFLGHFYFGDGAKLDYAEYDEYTSINDKGGSVSVIWTVGEPITEEKVFVALKIDAKDFDLGTVDFYLSECKTFEDGVVVDAGYVIKKQY